MLINVLPSDKGKIAKTLTTIGLLLILSLTCASLVLYRFLETPGTVLILTRESYFNNGENIGDYN
ncbi:hypothetical protein SFC15_19110 [Shouchella clausii]